MACRRSITRLRAAVGSWSGRCLSLGDYVTGMGPRTGRPPPEGDAQIAREADDLRGDVERAAMPAMSAEVRIGREDERIGRAHRGVRISFFK